MDLLDIINFSPTILLQKQCQKKNNLFFRDQIRSREVLVIVRIYTHTFVISLATLVAQSAKSEGTKIEFVWAQVNQNPTIAMTFRLNLRIYRLIIIIWLCLEMGVILPN
jgi:hypothetical protein